MEAVSSFELFFFLPVLLLLSLLHFSVNSFYLTIYTVTLPLISEVDVFSLPFLKLVNEGCLGHQGSVA